MESFSTCPMIAKLSEPVVGKVWFKMLADVEFALNNTIHSSTGTTASRLLFGVDQRGKIVDKIAKNLGPDRGSVLVMLRKSDLRRVWVMNFV